MSTTLPPSHTAQQVVADLARAALNAHAAASASRATYSWIAPSDRRYAIIARIPTDVDEPRAVAAVDGYQASTAEAALVARGWRFLPVPKHIPSRGKVVGPPKLDWRCRSWLAVPPEGRTEPARHFAKKREALAWAGATSQEVRS